MQRDARADRAAVGLDANQLHLQPVIAAGKIVAQQGRRLVHVHDQDVDISVIIEIAKGAATAGVRSRYSGTRLIDQLFELPARESAKHDARRAVRIAGKLDLDFRVDAARYGE